MWQLRPVDESAVADLSHELGVSPTVARLLWLRGFTDPVPARRFWDGREDLSFLIAPVASPELDKAVARLKRAFAEDESIVIYGDYDADGVTAAALLYRYLRHGPKARVTAYLPDRFTDGYGINAKAVRRLHAEGHRVIVTCDNGISAHEAAEVARELGIDLIVTDHHQMPPTLPAAYALVHPLVDFPRLRDLSGVGVALLLVIALEGGWSERLRPMLDLVALGSIADVVPLTGPNRALVWAGLQHIRASRRLRPGLQALIAITGHTKAETLTARNIAFSLAPMINAAGRIEQPGLAFDLLVTDDPAVAQALAQELQAINEERRELDRALVDRICADIDREGAHTADPFLVLADADFHHGITGIVAGRLKERYRKPVLLLSHHEGDVWKGSGRSLEGCHLYEALAHAEELLLGFGGHAQAAGCSIRESNIPELRRRLNAYLEALAWSPPEEAQWLEACPPLADYTPELIAELEHLEPTGAGNPAPALGLLNARVLRTRTDRSGRHLFLVVDDGETVREVVAWGQGDQAEAIGEWVHLKLRPKMKRYKGTETIELHAELIDRADPPPAPAAEETEASEGPAVVDHRQRPDRLRVVRERLASGRALAIYTGSELPALELDRAAGRRPVQYWSDRQSQYGEVQELILWERPASIEAWRRLTAGVAGTVHLLWESPVVEPLMSGGWLAAFHRELGRLGHLKWRQLVHRPWETTALMVESGLEMLQEAGLIEREGENWTLHPLPDAPIDLTSLAGYRQYLAAHEFRLLLANGPRHAVLAALGQPGLAARA